MVRLPAGPLACEVEPSLGGCIAGLHGPRADEPGLATPGAGESLAAAMTIEVERLA
jgi:hypothetical protein